MIVLFGFSITSWSLLSTKQNLTEWDWDIMRDAFNWGIWKVFGQVAEPYKSPASGMDAVSGTVSIYFATNNETEFFVDD